MPNLEIMGPYTNNYAGTDVKQFRNIIPIPNYYVSVFLANKATHNYFFTHIYPQMVIDNYVQDCTVFIDFFRASITCFVPNVDISAVHKTLPVAPPRNKALFEFRRRVIAHHLPALNVDLAQIQQSQIAIQLGAMVQMFNQIRIKDEEERRTTKEVKTVQKFAGDIRLNILLRNSRVATESDLAPVWNL